MAESVNIIRESTRNLLQINRRFHRDEESDSRRCVETLNISQESIKDIANKLKTKSSISLTELQTLKNGLMDDTRHIELVLATHGALRGLVRELTGSEIHKQCAAAGCCCNLALGDDKATLAVAKAAGPYLVAAVDSMTAELAVPCIWALGNLAGSNTRVTDLLTAQGALTKLCSLLTSGVEDVRDAAMYAVLHFVYQLKDDLRLEHLTKILEALSHQEMSPISSQILFIISCHNDFNINILTAQFYRKILESITVSIKNYSEIYKSKEKCMELIFLVRTLANVEINDEIYNFLNTCFMQNQLSNYFKVTLSNNNDLSQSVKWFLGNIFNYNSNNLFFKELLML